MADRVNFAPNFRRAFLLRFGYRCAYCNDKADRIDHFFPVSKGGTNDLDNLYPSCVKCNAVAGAKVFDSFIDKRIYIIKRRLAMGTIISTVPVPVTYLSRAVLTTLTDKEYGKCIDCKLLYRYARNTTVFLCPVCTYMNDNVVLPEWKRRNKLVVLSRKFKKGDILA